MFSWFKTRKKEAKVEPVAKSIEQAPKKVSTAKAISHPRKPHPEWEKLFLRVEPSTELHTVKRRILCEKRKYIVGKNRCVVYLEDKHNTEVNAFIAKYYDDIAHNFKRIGFTFIYAPKEVEKVANEYASPIPNVEWNAETILDLFYCRLYEPIGSTIVLFDETRNYRYASPEQPIIGALIGIQLNVDTEEGLMAIFKAYWNQLEEEYCTSPMVAYRPLMGISPEDECRGVTGGLFYKDGEGLEYKFDEEKPKRDIAAEMETRYYGGSESRRETGGLLFSEDGESAQILRDEELRQQRQGRIKEAEERKCYIRSEKQKSAGGGFLSGLMRKMKEVTDDVDTYAYDFLVEKEQSETLTKEDEQLLREIQERIERLHHSGIRQLLIEQMVRMTIKPSPLQVGDDARLLLTDYNKEVKMLPIDKVVYIFFLRHPEGVALKDMADHKEELTKLYQRVLGREKLSTSQVKSVGYLCDPLNNSINEKLSRIRQAFRAVAHDSVANCYIVQGERGEKRSITLSDEFIELGEWGRE